MPAGSDEAARSCEERAASERDAIAATERWFLRRGLPHFVYRFSSSRDVWATVVPIVLVVFVVEIAITAPDRRYPVLGSVALVIAGLGALVAIWALTNRLRGRRPLARPTRIGPVEVLLFVVGPALVPLVASGQWRSALVTVGANFVVLGLAYLERRYAIVSLARWALEHFTQQLRTVSGVLVRALPLLLLIVVVVFYTSEPWQIAHTLKWPVLMLGACVFIALAVLFAIIRAPGQIGELMTADPWSEICARVHDTPAAPLAVGISDDAPEPPPLSASERRNARMVVVVSEGTLVTIVSGSLFLFFVLLGLLTVPPDLARLWIGARPDVLFSFDLLGEHLAMTAELLKVAGFLAAFAALQFTVSLLSDGTYQEEFLANLRGGLRTAFAVRAVYLHEVLGDAPTAVPESPT
jgi:hypothetical protein